VCFGGWGSFSVNCRVAPILVAEEDRECGWGWPDPGPRGALGILYAASQVSRGRGTGQRTTDAALCGAVAPANQPARQPFYFFH
jgi:hypothetical protein